MLVRIIQIRRTICWNRIKIFKVEGYISDGLNKKAFLKCIRLNMLYRHRRLMLHLRHDKRAIKMSINVSLTLNIMQQRVFYHRSQRIYLIQ